MNDIFCSYPFGYPCGRAYNNRKPVAARTGGAKGNGLADDHDVRLVLQRERVQEHVHEVHAGQEGRDFGLHGAGEGVVHDQLAAGRAEAVHHVVLGLVPRPHAGRVVHHAFQVRAQAGRAGVRLADRKVPGVQVSAAREPRGKRKGGRTLPGRRELIPT